MYISDGIGQLEPVLDSHPCIQCSKKPLNPKYIQVSVDPEACVYNHLCMIGIISHVQSARCPSPPHLSTPETSDCYRVMWNQQSGPRAPSALPVNN